MTSIRLVARTEKLAFDLLRQESERNPGKNVWISPASISIAFGILLNAARTTTRTKLVKTLGLDFEDAATNNVAYANLITAMKDPSSGIELGVANSIWTQKGVKFKRAFLKANRESFGSKVAARNLATPETLAEIQKYIFDNTAEKIKDFPDGISADAVMLILQAIAWQAPWLTKFDRKLTRPGVWNNTREHDMMFLPNGASQSYIPDVGRVGVMPFGNSADRFNFVGILPMWDKKVEDVVANLQVGAMSKVFGSLRPVNDGLYFPRFKIDVKTKLNASLQALGLEELFCEAADLSGMLTGKARPFVSSVDHQAMAQFDEMGAVGAAATKIEAVTESVPRPMSFDQPFVGMVYDRDSGAMVKIGVVYDPEKITQETNWGDVEGAADAVAGDTAADAGEVIPE
jgi:serine protease inhibitor